MHLKIAIRNVHKNMKSSVLNGIGIVLAFIAVVFIFSLSRGIENQVVRRNIRFETGAVTILFKREIAGFDEKERGNKVYREVCAVLDDNVAVTDYRPRINTYNATLYGLEGAKRVRVKGITRDDYPVLNQMVKVTESIDGWEDHSNGLLISRSMAEEAGLSLGDDCHIVLPSADGTINMMDFVVTAVFRDTSQGNKSEVYTGYDRGKELYHTNLPTHLLVEVAGLDQADSVADELLRVFNEDEIEVKTYKDGLSTARAISGINRNFMSGMVFFLIFISFVGIWAMQTEQVNERCREIGTLLATGFSWQSVKRIFLFESVYSGVLFVLIGIVISVVLNGFIQMNDGLYLGDKASFAFGSAIIQPEMKGGDLMASAVIVILYPLVATILSLISIHRIPVITLLNKQY